MKHTYARLLSLSMLLVGTTVGLVNVQIASAQQTPMKRTELLKTTLPDFEGKDMHVWVADIAPGAATARHYHPTPRFVYVVEGAVVLEMDGKPPQTFETGQAFVEMPNLVHTFKNASATAPAKALGFQYGGKEQPLQIAAP